MERDRKTKDIEDDVNEELNTIQEYEELKHAEKVEFQEKQLKPSDLQGLRDQLFVNPRQFKLRQNIEQLMVELKKIKAMDPSLEAFNQMYRTRQKTASSLGNYSRKDLNEIEILMEILSATGDSNTNELPGLHTDRMNTPVDRLIDTPQHQQRLMTQEHTYR